MPFLVRYFIDTWVGAPGSHFYMGLRTIAA
jgi:hypothetical protein